MFLNPFGPTEANALGLQIYEFILTNWGNMGEGVGTGGCQVCGPQPLTSQCIDPYSLGYPAKLTDEPVPTVVGIAIAPQSDVDQVLISYNAYPPPTPQTRIGGLLDLRDHTIGLVDQVTDQVVSVHRPFFGVLNGNMAIRPVPWKRYGDEYYPFGAAGPADFLNSVTATVIPPMLRLQIYLQGPVPQLTHRAPYMNAFAISNNGGLGVREFVRAIPVMGRRNVQVSVRSRGTNPAQTITLEIGGIRIGDLPRQPIGTNPDLIECQLLAPTTIDNTLGDNFCVNFNDPQVDFLTFYMTTAVDAAQASLVVHVDAVD